MFSIVKSIGKLKWGSRRDVLLPALAVVTLLVPAGVSAYGQSAQTAANCASLAKLHLPEATVTMAEVVEPMAFKLPASKGGPGPGGPGPGGPGAGGPGPGGPGGGMALAPFDPKDTTNHVPFCRVAATLRPSAESDIKIEVWLPLAGWNGKLMGAGDFGWAGSIMYGGLLLGLERGFAAVSTDTGHDNSLANGEFAMGHPDKAIDYGYRAAHSMTLDAKQFVQAFYGEPATHAYWFGCSLGGQMGLTEIQRFPDDYDAAIVGAPANPIVELNAYQIWPSLLLVKNPAGQLTRAKAAMLHDAVLKACDALDGALDGEIEDPTACHFDPKTVQCTGADSDACLTAPQVQFVQMLYTGPISARTGKKIHEGAAPGNETNFGQYSPNNAMGVATALFKYMIFEDPSWDWKTLDMDRDVAYGNAVLRTVNIADNPNLKPFFDRGGKLLMYHGWADGNTPMASVAYLEAVKKTVGSELTDKSMRLFNVPAMGHCSGGSGCDVFDKLGELDKWVETAKAPERIVASKVQGGKVVRTHPICAWPEVAKYQGSGSLNDAANFACVRK